MLCDKFVEENVERECHSDIAIDRPFVVGDAGKIPFKDKAFDYVICKHLLEHLNSLKIFLEKS